ncbi:MAG: glycosyltransferase family 2 protein [Candidatus Omnitrophica bacterium]|nr:glycosyltransferase family 2 protein [Candidatus Omnitrophota bacterium]
MKEISTQNTKISIVIVTYNAINLIDQCLKSVFDNKTKWDFTVCVVDNGSNDGTPDHIQQDFPNIDLIRNRNNLGYAHANNQGITHTQSDYVLLLNPDTIIPQNTFQALVDLLESDQGIGIVSPKLVRLNGEMDLACRRMFPDHLDFLLGVLGVLRKFPKNRILGHYNLTFLDPNETTEVDAVAGAFLLARRVAIDKVGLLDETFFMYGEDIDWCYRFKLNGWRVIYYPKVVVTHYKGETSKRFSHHVIYHFYRSNALLYKKYLSKKTPFIINWILYSANWINFSVSYIYNYFLPKDKKRVA